MFLAPLDLDLTHHRHQLLANSLTQLTTTDYP